MSEGFVDWDGAVVTVKVTVHGTAQSDIQEIDMPLANFFAIAEHLHKTDLERIQSLTADQF